MKLPKAEPHRTHTVYLDHFDGLHAQSRANDGDLISCINLSSDRYPKMGTRAYRSKYATINNPQGITGYDMPIWVDDNVLVYGGSKLNLPAGNKRLMATDGRYTVILPDGKCLENKTVVLHDLCLKWESNVMTFSDGFLSGQAACANAVTLTGDIPAFKVGDAVEIKGCTAFPENNGTRIIRGISPTGNVLYFDEGSFTLRNGASYDEIGSLCVQRNVPDADYLFVSGSRFWCADGNQVYACKMGDPFNWFVYDGLSSDSYALEITAGGSFTGACDFAGTPVFFKENAIYRILGTRPSNFELVSVTGPGVMRGCEKSLAEISGALYYLSREGIMVWAGGSPHLLRSDLDLKGATNAVGGSDGRRYWINLIDREGERRLYVYDTVSGIWTQHDDCDVVQFVPCENGLHLLDERGVLWRSEPIVAGPVGRESTFRSEAVFAPIRCDTHKAKTFQSLSLRMVLEEETSAVTATVSYDGQPELPAGFVSGQGEVILQCPICPRRADSFQLYLRGSGQWSLSSMQYTYTEGAQTP